MNASFRKIALTLLTTLAATTLVASTASAESKALRLHPGSDPHFAPQPFLPKFGFSSVNIHGIGERVTHVRFGGLASRFGLEPGDVILSLNGRPLSYHGSWNDSLHLAMFKNGGLVRLKIRDVRTGIIATRQMFVGDHGPNEHFHGDAHVHFGQPNGPVTHKSKFPPHTSNGSNAKIKKIGIHLD